MLIALALLAAAATPTPAKTPSAAQVAARQRMSQCAKQYQADKAGGKLPTGQKWPTYYSACAKKLKG